MNKLIKAALIRALYTVCESLASTLPIGFVITPAMIQSFDWSFLYVVAAWIGTALLAGLFAFLRALISGLPEVEDEEFNEDDWNEDNWEDDDED